MADYSDNREETESEEERSVGDRIEDLDFEPDDRDGMMFMTSMRRNWMMTLRRKRSRIRILSPSWTSKT